MKIITVLIIFLSLPSFALTSTSLKITVRSFDEPDQITEISSVEKTQTINPNHKIWKLKPARFSKLIKQFIGLPGTVDKVSTCPREYIKFEYHSENAVRIEFTCNDTDTSTHRKYLAFAKQII